MEPSPDHSGSSSRPEVERDVEMVIPLTQNSTTRPRKKTPNACQRCRVKKIKCSGQALCRNCTRRSIHCNFDDGDKKVTVSERYLNRLRGAAGKRPQQQALNISRHDTPPSEDYRQPSPVQSETPAAHARHSNGTQLPVNNDISISHAHLNPLSSANTRSFLVTDNSGRQRHPGYSSTWSFSWQIRGLLKDAIKNDLDVQLTPEPEGGTYALASMTLQNTRKFDIKSCPSRDFAVYLTTTTLFHFSPIYYLFEKEDFLNKVDILYHDRSSNSLLSHLWLAQFFLVMAFGKLLLGRGSTENRPPGMKEFLVAMDLLPDIPQIYRSQVLGTEVLCLICLYFESADMRSVAHNYIGQAQRLALSIGMHREGPPGCLDEREREHRRKLWWTVYIIDRKLSMSMGCPSSIQDSDIDLSWPSSDRGLTLHIKIASLVGRVLAAAYALNGAINASYIFRIQNIFEGMKELATEFSGEFDWDPNKGSQISKASATLHLLYYQCTIQATRCIVFLLIQKRISSPQDVLTKQRPVSDSVAAMVKTCVGAASTSLAMLSLLHSEDLIDPFVPSDLECTFSSASILILSTIAYPGLNLDIAKISTASSILNWMSGKGNVIARTRQREIVELQAMARNISETWSHVPFMSELEPGISDCLWKALDIQDVDRERNQEAAVIDLLGQYTGLGDEEMNENMMDEIWFWGADEGTEEAPHSIQY